MDELFKLSVNGMGAVQLSNHITSLTSNLSVKVWHTAMCEGYIVTGRTKRVNADINIVADDYHAHAVIPMRLAPLILLAHDAKFIAENSKLTLTEQANVEIVREIQQLLQPNANAAMNYGEFYSAELGIVVVPPKHA